MANQKLNLRRKVIVTSAIALVLVIILIAVLAMNFNRVARRAVQEALRYALQVEATVGSLHVDPKEQTVEIGEIVIPNPAPFSSNNALELGSVLVQIDLASFSSDAPKIKQIALQEPRILMEYGEGTSNLEQLIANTNRLSSGQESTAAEEKPAEESGQTPLLIEKVAVTGGQVSLTLPLVKEQTFSIALPDIHMTNLGGKKEEKVTPAQAVGLLLERLMQEALKAGRGVLPADVLGLLNESAANAKQLMSQGLAGLTQELGKGGKQLEEAGRDVLDQTQQLGEQAGQAAEKLTQGLGGLLKKKDTTSDE